MGNTTQRDVGRQPPQQPSGGKQSGEPHERDDEGMAKGDLDAGNIASSKSAKGGSKEKRESDSPQRRS
jgi:hypothetical protein